MAAAKADVVTWNPAGASPALLGTQFSFDQLKVEDFGRIVLSGAGPNFNFNEGGVLNVTQAHLFGNLPTATYTPGGLGTTYQLYLTFTAAGTTTAPDFVTPTSSTATGTFTSLTYHLFGTNNVGNFAPPGSTAEPSPVVPSVLLGSGSLIDGSTSLTVTNVAINGNPGANCSPGTEGVPGVGRCLQIGPGAAPLNLTFTPNPSESGFFVTPPATGPVTLTLAGAFTNDFSNVTLVNSTTVDVNAGGGTLSPHLHQTSTPEPASLAVLGGAMVGFGLLRRRKRS